MAEPASVCNHKRVARLMRVNAIQGVSRRRKRPTTTNSKPTLPVAPNVLNPKWRGDISYIDTLEDGCSPRIVGWAMADHMATSLVERALDRALFHRQPQGDLLHHSDRGSQYASHDYRRLLDQRGITVSMSRTATCHQGMLLCHPQDRMRPPAVR